MRIEFGDGELIQTIDLPLPRGLMNFVKPTPRTYAGEAGFFLPIVIIVSCLGNGRMAQRTLESGEVGNRG